MTTMTDALRIIAAQVVPSSASLGHSASLCVCVVVCTSKCAHVPDDVFLESDGCEQAESGGS